MGDAMTRAYRDGVLEAEHFAVADVSVYLERPDTVVWVDLCGPSKDQLLEIEGELGLHELAVEDALGPHQRPKLDRYASHLFLSVHAVRVDAEGGSFAQTEVDAFINERWLITVRKDDGFDIAPMLQRWDRSPDLAAQGVGFLLYGLLDAVVDTYFDAIQSFDDYYEQVSEGIFEERPLEPAGQRRWFEMRQAMVRFHRLVVPMREAVSSLMRRENAGVSEELYPYFQDVYDHILRVSESSDSLRDLVSSLVETNISLRDGSGPRDSAGGGRSACRASKSASCAASHVSRSCSRTWARIPSSRSRRSACGISSAAWSASACPSTSNGLTEIAQSPSSSCAPGVLREDEHAVALVHERRLLRDEVEPVVDRVDEQHVELLVRGDRLRRSRPAMRRSMGSQPSRWKRSLTRASRRAGSRPRYSDVLGDVLPRRVEQGQHADAPAAAPVPSRGSCSNARKPRTTFFDGSVRSTRRTSRSGRRSSIRRSAASTPGLDSRAPRTPSGRPRSGGS